MKTQNISDNSETGEVGTVLTIHMKMIRTLIIKNTKKFLQRLTLKLPLKMIPFCQ